MRSTGRQDWLLVYRVRSWRHGDCYLDTLEAAIAHARRDLNCAHPGKVSITRHRVPSSWWAAVPLGCNHAEVVAAGAIDDAGQEVGG